MSRERGFFLQLGFCVVAFLVVVLWLMGESFAQVSSGSPGVTGGNSSGSAGVSSLAVQNNGTTVGSLSGSVILNFLSGCTSTVSSQTFSLTCGGGGLTLGTAAQVPVMNAGATAYAPVSFSQDCTITSLGVVTCLKSNNVAFASGAFAAAYSLPAQYAKGQCTEVWGGTNTGNALQSGDDAIADNGCYNDSGVTRTITAVKCRSDNASNTTTVNPTFGSAGTGTTILSGAVTCGSSYAYSSSGTVSTSAWTTGSGIDPAMGGTLTGTSIAMIVEYTY